MLSKRLHIGIMVAFKYGDVHVMLAKSQSVVYCTTCLHLPMASVFQTRISSKHFRQQYSQIFLIFFFLGGGGAVAWLLTPRTPDPVVGGSSPTRVAVWCP